MASLAQLTTSVQTVLTTHATTAAQATKCVQRTRRFTGALWVQTLVLGCWQTPATTLTHLAQMAAVLGVPVSPQAIAQRFTPATVECLERVLGAAVQQRLSAEPVASAVLARFAAVEVLDTTTIALPRELATAWPGCGNGSGQSAAALKVGVRLDVRHGTLTGPLLETGRTHDRRCAITTQPLPPGALRVADLGFWSVSELADLRQQNCFWLSRLQAQTTVRHQEDPTWQLDQVLATTAAASAEWPVTVGAAGTVPARLLAVRVPTEVAAERRRHIWTDAKRRGHTPRQTRLQRADWLLLVTSVPAEQLRIDEAVVLMRARWQIELLFKQWKSAGRLATVRSRDPYRVLAEVYAKLIGLVVQHWVVLGGWTQRNRSYGKAAQLVRAFALPIGQSLGSYRALHRILANAVAAVAHAGVINPRRKHPNCYQLLLALETESLS